MKRPTALALVFALLSGLLVGFVPGMGAAALAVGTEPAPSSTEQNGDRDVSDFDVSALLNADDEPSAGEEEGDAEDKAGVAESEDESAEETVSEGAAPEDTASAEPARVDDSADESSADLPSQHEESSDDSRDGPDEDKRTQKAGDEDEKADDETSDASDLAPLSGNTAGTNIGSMTFYAYVAQGENLDVAIARVGGGGPDATVTVEGPGVGPFSCIIAGSGGPPPCEMPDLTGDPGVWRIVLAGGGPNTRFDWQVDVQDGPTTIDGRVWTENYSMRQTSADPLVDFTFWYQSQHGYLYEADYNGYNGINSIFRADSTGVRHNDTCTSAYASIVFSDQQGEVPDPDRSISGLGECGDPYKIFFEAPASDLPTSFTRWDGSTDWIVPPIEDPAITDLTFTPDSPSTHAGTISYEVENFTGQLMVEIDTDNDGTFDRTIPGSAVDGSGSVSFDGLAGNGNAVSTSQDMPVRVSIARVGEIHFANVDVEVRSGGLQVTRLNGPDAGDRTLYWDDTDLSTTAPCGTWTPTLDGTGGVDSTGGVHWWNVDGCAAISGGWGDARIVDDWTYVPVDEAMEITVPGEAEVPPSLECPAGSQLVPVDLIQNPSYEDRTGDFVNDDSDSTIGFAEHWYDSHPTGGQYHYFSPTFDSGPPAGVMPVRSGSHGYGFMGGHSSGGVGEGATNTLAEPLVPGARYVGYFSMAAGGYNRQGDGYMEFFGTNDREVGHIGGSGVVAPTADNIESLYETPVVNYPGAGVTPTWEQSTFTLVPTEAWDHLRVEVRNANPANDGTVAGQTWINFDDFHMFLCAAPVIEKTSDATEDTRAGDTVTYTVTATNPTSVDLTDIEVLDDLTGVLDDGTLDESSLSANPDTGTLAFNDPTINWRGDLASGDTVTITYEVALTGDGDGSVRNVAFVPCDPADPDCDQVTPECDPPDENGRDPETGLPCAETEFELPRLVIEKTADKTDLPAVGETVTYTVVAENVGPGDYTANAPAPVTDDLSDVLDDATLDESSLSADRPGTPTFTDPMVNWEGEMAAGEKVTITYTVEYTGEGDNILLNEACVPEEQTAPDAESCDSVRVPAALIEDEKSVQASDDPVVAGTVLTYTLTFRNTGEAAGTVDAYDDLNHVLDDGDLTSGPTVSDAALTADGPDGDNRFHITGTLAPDQEVTVTYEVTVKPDGERGDNVAVNFLVDPDTDPLCDPADPDCERPECEDGDEDCTETKIGEVEDKKDVQASDDPIVEGSVLTYTLTFENVGEAPAPVNKVDDMSGVLDDAALTAGPTVSDGALTASGPDGDGLLAITGTLDPGAVVTVTYEVAVNPDGERGDNVAANFLVPRDEVCEPDDPDCEYVCEPGVDEDCTETPLGEIKPEKSVDPESGTTVLAGDVLTYTLTFENVGEAPTDVGYDDLMDGVLDDADLTDGPTASDPALTVAGPDGDGRISVTGTLNPGDVATVTYEVTVKPDGERGDNLLGNFVVKPGEELCEDDDPDCEIPECEADDPLCTENPVPEIKDWKEVDPASDTVVTAGRELTYTLSFTNDGEAAGDVEKVDDLTHVLDDAELIDGPSSSDEALSVSGPDDADRITITGELDRDQTVTVTYTVRVKDADERGDDLLANFLIDPNGPTPDPEDCEPADDENADCARNPVGDVTVEKSVNPESGTEVAAGEELTYTLTFENAGKGEAKVDHVDHAAGIADDAALIGGPDVSTDALSVDGPDDERRFHITGTLGAGESATVTYTVRVKAYDEQGDGLLENFLVPAGVEPPEECVESDPTCTQNPIGAPAEQPPGEQPPPDGPDEFLPDTGSAIPIWMLVTGVVLLLSGAALAVATRRREEADPTERTVGIDGLL